MAIKLDIYDVIKRPIITEKATILSENNQVVFEVSTSATKTEIKQAVEQIFSTKVKAVNVINSKGKTKRFRGVNGRRADSKKAIISLAEGETIDVTG